MTDSNTVKDTVAESERRLAQHSYVDAQGNATDSIETASGNQYKSKSGFTRTWILPDGKAKDMLAAFGARTLMINTTSGARQRDEDEQQALDDRWAQITAGQWRERGEGVARGPKYDKAILAQALHTVLTAAQQAKGDVPHYLERLEDRGYYAKVRANPKVMQEYYSLAGSAANTDSLA